MGPSIRGLLLVLGLVLGLPACLAGPQPDPPVFRGGDDYDADLGAARDGAPGLIADAGIAGPASDAGLAPPPADPSFSADSDGAGGRSQAGEEAAATERRVDIFDPERILPGPTVPQDAGPDADDDAEVPHPRSRHPRH